MLIIKRIIKKNPFNRFGKLLNRKNNKLYLNDTITELNAIYPPADVTPLHIDIDIDNIDNINNIKNFNLSLTIFECLSFYMIVIMYIIAATINKVLLTIDRNKRNK
tara:strand:- start:61 stop:378 length:318 start_codon:yes stop_codon:yes gene_type:complete